MGRTTRSAVRPSPRTRLGLVFDIGGTNIRIAIVRNGKLTKPTILPAPLSFNGLIDEVTAYVRDHADDHTLSLVVGGIAGPLDRDHGTLVASPHLPWLVGAPLKSTLQKRLRTSVVLDNDNALVGLGEAHYGAGKGFPIVAYLGIGTGVGGSRIVDGTIDRASKGFEPGHQLLDPRSTSRCACGQRGDLESLISGDGIRQRFGAHAETLTRAAVWHDVASWLGRGLANVSVLWSPDAIVLGGSVMKSLRWHLPSVTASLKQSLSVLPTPPTIVVGTLGDFGGLYGGLHLFKTSR